MSLNIKLDNWVYSRLAEPFSPSEVRFRPSGYDAILAYLDARTVAERLNQVVGAENWHDEYVPIAIKEVSTRPIDENGNVVTKPLKEVTYSQEAYTHYYEGIQCNLTVLGVTKSDVGTPSMAEQLKGATSDALKRAAVKFGVGAYLYDLKELRGGKVAKFKVVENPTLPEWALPVERANPKEAILKLVEEVKALDLEDDYRDEVTRTISPIFAFGSYDSNAPLVVQRAVYEYLTEVIRVAR